MKLPQNLYSRLTLLSCITLVTWYALVYAWTTLNPVDAGPGKPLTSTLMQAVMNNVNELNGRFGTLTAGQWCTSDGTKVICTTNAPVGGMGVGQTWQDVMGSRALNTTFTNSTGKPIMVYATFMCGAWTVSSLFATVGGVGIGAGSNAGSGGGIGFISFIVPAGATYRLDQNTVVTATLQSWVELR